MKDIKIAIISLIAFVIMINIIDNAWEFAGCLVLLLLGNLLGLME